MQQWLPLAELVALRSPYLDVGGRVWVRTRWIWTVRLRLYGSPSWYDLSASATEKKGDSQLAMCIVALETALLGFTHSAYAGTSSLDRKTCLHPLSTQP